MHQEKKEKRIERMHRIIGRKKEKGKQQKLKIHIREEKNRKKKQLGSNKNWKGRKGWERDKKKNKP